MNRLEEYGYAGLYKALKHKYKYALSTNLPCVSRHSQFLALLYIFPELISLQESCRSRFRLISRLFGCLKFLLLLIVRHIFEISDDHLLRATRPRYLMNFRLRYAFLFPGVNSRAELVPSHRANARNGASRRWLGDKTMQHNNKALEMKGCESMKGCVFFRVKSWFYPNMVSLQPDSFLVLQCRL